ncbi:MAG: hypothetical protein FJW69_09330 [Actinobacteria bacterium]|nr:hypothetical protein [Actinomycetota bacterium]
MADTSANIKGEAQTVNAGEEINVVSQKIIDDVLLQKQEILNDAEKKQKEILDSAERKRKEILDDAKKKAQERYDKVYELEILNAKSKINQELLLFKIKTIEDLISKVKERLKTINSEEFLKVLKDTLNSLKLSESEYQIGKNEELISGELLEEISKKIGFKKSKEKADFDTGIKIIDGKKEYMLSAETLINEKIDIIKIKLSKFLFEKE